MRYRYVLTLIPLIALAACGAPSLETRTFELQYLDGGTAEQLIVPYVYTDRPKAPGRLSTTAQTITVRETGDNLERIARVLAEYDRRPASVRLVFTVIRADGAGTPDSSIAAVETQLRRLFRFRGYRVVAQAVTVGVAGTRFHQQLSGTEDLYVIRGEIETVGVRGDSGVIRLDVSLEARRAGSGLGTRLSIAIGQTAVIGGQPGTEPGALILAVRPELVAP